MTPDEIEDAEYQLAQRELALLRAEGAAQARHSFRSFCLYMFPEYVWSWFHLRIMDALEHVASASIRIRKGLPLGEGDTRFLILNVPPQHGKTTLATVLFPAYLLGIDPDNKITAGSYSASKAIDFNRQCQALMSSERYQEVFPGTRLPLKNVRTITDTELRNSDVFQIRGKKGLFRALGFDSGFTGYPMDTVLLDDPIKGFEEANSPTIREKRWQIYKSDVEVRARVRVLIQTRWHQDDPAGRAIAQAANDPRSPQPVVISIPAKKVDVADTSDPRDVGDYLWTDNPKFQSSDYATFELDQWVWNALFQQQPVPLGGGIIKTFNFRFWYHEGTEPAPMKLADAEGNVSEIPQEPLPDDTLRFLQSWDTALKEGTNNDYNVGQFWACNSRSKPSNAYLMDQVRAKGDFTTAESMVKSFSERFMNIGEKWIEDKANGPAILSSLKKTIPGLQAAPVRTHKSEGGSGHEMGKIDRAVSVTPYINAHNVFIPHPSVSGMGWVLDFLKECANFPKDKHDDQVDAMSQALWLIYGTRPLRIRN